LSFFQEVAEAGKIDAAEARKGSKNPLSLHVIILMLMRKSRSGYQLQAAIAFFNVEQN
jgi:hypothetical protein